VGNARIKFDIATDEISTTAHAQIRKNSVALGTDKTKSGGWPDTYTTFSEDLSISCLAGGTIELWVSGNPREIGIIYTKNFRIYYANSVNVLITGVS
jgi:hypothetical protein